MGDAMSSSGDRSPRPAVAAKMSAEGVDPAILDMDPTQPVSGGAAGAAQGNGVLPSAPPPRPASLPPAAPREADPAAPVVLPARLRLLDGM